VHLGIGTGNTAMRSMGQRPMRIAEYGEYLRVLGALLPFMIVLGPLGYFALRWWRRRRESLAT